MRGLSVQEQDRVPVRTVDAAGWEAVQAGFLFAGIQSLLGNLWLQPHAILQRSYCAQTANLSEAEIAVGLPALQGKRFVGSKNPR